MSYSLILVQVPPGSTEEEVEQAVQAANAAESARSPQREENESLMRRLAESLLADCPELRGGEVDHAAIAKTEKITDDEARQRYRWWHLEGPEDGAGIEITLYDAFVSIDMAMGGTDEDWNDVWRYVDILVREGGFVVWDPQGPNVVERPAENASRRPKNKRAKKVDRDSVPDDVEPEDERRGGDVAKLITHIVDDAIAAPLSAAGYRRSGRTWRRQPDNDATQVVNVQWSPRREGEAWLTLNAGVYFPALATSLALFPVTKTPKEFDCHVRFRPQLAGGGWTVRVVGTTETDADLDDGLVKSFFSWLDRRADRKAPQQHERATRELRESLEREAFPWLERVSALQGARDELVRRGTLFWAAHASVLLGEREEAARLLERELAKSVSNPEYSKTVREWGRANSLT